MAERVETISLNLTRRVSAPPHKVFLAFTDPDMLKLWWGPETHSCPVAELDPRPGGRWRTCMLSPEGNEYWAQGEYREVSPPTRLVFTWAWEADGVPGHETLVTVDFVEVDGGTEIVFRHEGFETEEARNQHDQGWTSSLAGLLAHLGD
jgi:uncharacterized protein YndB with AHSA1/START domain